MLSERLFEASGGFAIAQNDGIYTVFCACLAENDGIYTVFCACLAETDGIYTVFCAFPAHNRGAPLDRRLQNMVNTNVLSSSCLVAWP